MNESISRAAGNEHGEELPPERMQALIESVGRIPEQRTTLYGSVGVDRQRCSFGAPVLTPIVLTAPSRTQRVPGQPAVPA